MAADVVAAPAARSLTEAEYEELGLLEALGSARSDEQSDRYRHLMIRKCPEPSAEVQREQRERLEAQGIDFKAAYATFNRGDVQAVEEFLETVAPPPRAEVEQLERRINTALRAMSTRRPRLVRTSRPACRGRGRAPRSRRVRVGSRRGPPREPDEPEHDLASSSERVAA